MFLCYIYGEHNRGYEEDREIQQKNTIEIFLIKMLSWVSLTQVVMAILIDGFNLIYKFPEFEGLMYQGKLSDARKGLLNKLKEYVKITGARIRVVFDGKKEPSLEVKSESVGTIDVYYSLEYSADYLIKEFIKKDPNPKTATVVTSDKDIISFVQRFRVKIKKSEEFADHINKTIEKWLESRLPEKEENPVLTDEEIVFWENLFNNGKT